MRITSILLLGFALLVASCGQKGPLVLPDAEKTVSTQQEQNEEQMEEQKKKDKKEVE